ncbi:hypothetical protein SAY87_012740 [Trapa incisa]|uniref:Uncharacterized protein n=1 Tax=Trapa incisa TaxID=236973 RepID=A0AAN7GKI8_9MYRT|nr:hypothetical protein SAY87_012740 [Trapa incisa]
MCVGFLERAPLLRQYYSRLRKRAVPAKQRGSSLRVLRRQRRRRRRRMLRMEMENFKLFMKNQRIIQENELLREKALLLHQENAALLILLRNKFSGGSI